MTPWLPSPLNYLENKGKMCLPKRNAFCVSIGMDSRIYSLRDFFFSSCQKDSRSSSASLGHLHSQMHPFLLHTCQWHHHSLRFQPIFRSSASHVILFESWLRCSVSFFPIIPAFILAQALRADLAGP